MQKRWLLVMACALLGACTTPYSPPVYPKDSPDFPGLVDMLSPDRPLDVVLVHGMCTHDAKWAQTAITSVVGAMKANVSNPKSAARPQPAPGVTPLPEVEVVDATAETPRGSMKLTALIWSPLTAPLKQKLKYDNTGEPTHCANETSDICKPKRAYVNGVGKDKLLNDCLSDAIIYEGESGKYIRAAMADALSGVLKNRAPDAPLAIVADSLGSKIIFDTLSEMLAQSEPAAESATARLSQVFMNANQMPILGLSGQSIADLGRSPMASPAPSDAPAAAPSSPPDALQRFLRRRSAAVMKEKSKGNPSLLPVREKLAVVAFTDPNDLLSYRIVPSKYIPLGVSVSDVLVSNQKTYFGFIARPDTVHMQYIENPDVARDIACGKPKSAMCK